LNSYLKYRNFLSSLQFEYAVVYSRQNPKGFGKFERKPSGSKSSVGSRQTESPNKTSEIEKEDLKASEEIKKQWKEDTWGDLNNKESSEKEASENTDEKISEKDDNSKNSQTGTKKKDSLNRIKKNLKYFSENRKTTSSDSKSKKNEDKKDGKKGSDKKKENNSDKENSTDKRAYFFTLFTAGVLGNFIMRRFISNTYEENISYAELERLILDQKVEKLIMRQINLSGEASVFADIYIKADDSSNDSNDGGIVSKLSSTSTSISTLAVTNPNNFLATLENMQSEKLNKETDQFFPIEFSRKRDYTDYLATTMTLLRHAAVIAIMCWSVKQFSGIAKEMSKTMNKFNNKTKNTAKTFDVEDNIKVRFTDVAGCEQAKVEIKEFVDFLRYPDKYKKVGAKLPTGA